MAKFIYVDNSNVWIEGMRVAAVVNGVAPDIWTAQEDQLTYPWRVDFGRLLELAGGEKDEVGRAVLYGSRPPANDSLWAPAKRRGFDVVIYDRNATNREKKLDTQITEVDAMPERFMVVSREGVYTRLDYARYADDLVIRWHDWPLKAMHWRLGEELETQESSRCSVTQVHDPALGLVQPQLTADIVEDSFELMEPERDGITLVAGDKDYVPAAEKTRKRGFTFDVLFWDHAARELKDAATHFISLNRYLDLLRLK